MCFYSAAGGVKSDEDEPEVLEMESEDDGEFAFTQSQVMTFEDKKVLSLVLSLFVCVYLVI